MRSIILSAILLTLAVFAAASPTPYGPLAISFPSFFVLTSQLSLRWSLLLHHRESGREAWFHRLETWDREFGA